MKKVLYTLILSFLSMASAYAADGDEGFYTRADAGYADAKRDGFSNGYAVQTGFGQKWGGFLRNEFTLEYTHIRLKSKNIRSSLPSWAAMTTMYVDLFSVRGVTPYVGVGIGGVRNDMPDVVVDGRPEFGKKTFHASFKGTGGIGVELPSNLTLDVGYVYADSGRFVSRDEAGVTRQRNVKTRKVSVGLRYNF